ncbi:MAG: hypothetical protein QXS16_04825 [Pyrobaculum sp.]
MVYSKTLPTELALLTRNEEVDFELAGEVKSLGEVSFDLVIASWQIIEHKTFMYLLKRRYLGPSRRV